eukprot:347525-Pyramimonas_sp.AAC.1
MGLLQGEAHPRLDVTDRSGHAVGDHGRRGGSLEHDALPAHGVPPPREGKPDLVVDVLRAQVLVK